MSDYDAALWAAADRYMSEGAIEAEVEFTVERDVDALPEVLRVALPHDAECVELKVYTSTGDSDAVVTHLVTSPDGVRHLETPLPHITIPLTEGEMQWACEVAIEDEELRHAVDELDMDGDR